MTLRLLILLFAAHVITDYGIQNEKLVLQKRKNQFQAFIIHVTSYFICASLFTFPWMSVSWFIMISIQTIFHLVFDILKIRLVQSYKQYGFQLELIDFILHIMTIYISVQLLRPVFSSSFHILWIDQIYQSSYFIQFFILLSAFILITRGGTVFIRSLLDSLKITGKFKKSAGEPLKTGCWIGHFERLLIFLLVISNGWTGIGFILAAKSIARFKELDERIFAEYYLIGTLLSTLIAVLAGFAYLQISHLYEGINL